MSVYGIVGEGLGWQRWMAEEVRSGSSRPANDRRFDKSRTRSGSNGDVVRMQCHRKRLADDMRVSVRVSKR